MTFDQIREWIEKNSELDLDLEKASRKLPQLQATAINMRAEETRLLKKLEIDLIDDKKERWIYYSGKAEPEVYKKEPFELKVLKTDIDMFIDGDKKIREKLQMIENQRVKVQMLDEYIRSLHQRTFIIKNINDTIKLQNGLV